MGFTITPTDAARLFLISLTNDPKNDAERLGQMMITFCKQATETALKDAKKTYSNIHSGGCRMLSQGSQCNCFLCQIDRKLTEIQ